MEAGLIKTVFISDDIAPECTEILSNSGIKVTSKTKLAEVDLIKELQGFDGLIVRSATTVTRNVIQKTNLKVIGRAGTGVDNIDMTAATEKGVVVLNTPDGNSQSAAELTCFLIGSLARRIPEACRQLKMGKWERKAFMGTEVDGKTLALIGLGRIGREVAVRVQAMGMEVISYDPIIPPEEFKKANVRQVTLDELWAAADYISVHVPLIKPTANMINASTLAKCKKGVRILNVARGGIINEEDLLAAVESGHVAGAALDVFAEEPPKNTKLIANERIIVTPHLGASTKEAQLRVAKEVAEQIVALHKGQPVSGALNAPIQGGGCNGNAKLARQLAVVLDALTDAAKVSEVLVEAPGCVKERALTAEVAIGYLRSRSDGNLNLVNCQSAFKSSGLKVTVNQGKGDLVKMTASDSTGAVLLTLTGATSNFGSFLTGIDGADFFTPVPLVNTLVFNPVTAEMPKTTPDVLFYNTNGKWKVYGYKDANVVPGVPAVTIVF